MTRRECTLLCQRCLCEWTEMSFFPRKILPKCARWQPKAGGALVLVAELWFTIALTKQAAGDGNSQLQPKF